MEELEKYLVSAEYTLLGWNELTHKNWEEK